jgi:hypothetical protein
MFEEWGQYIAWLAREYDAGRDVAELNVRISRQQVHWKGTIAKVEIEGRSAPALTLKMTPAEVPLADGRMFNGEHLSLPVRGNVELKKAAKAQAGQTVYFAARISNRDHIFPPVSFIPSDAQNRVYATLGLDDVELLQFTS